MAAILGLVAPAVASADPLGSLPPKSKALAVRLGAVHVSIEEACEGGAGCPRAPLDRVFTRIERAKAKKGVVRVLHLGDSHVAADLITKTIRRDLQEAYGGRSRGFTVIDQKLEYGGRRIKGTKGWAKDRIVDTGRAGRPYGFSGTSLTAQKKGAKLQYRIVEADRRIRLFFGVGPSGGKLELRLGDAVLGAVDTKASKAGSRVEAFELPKGEAKARTLELIAQASGPRLYGISFEDGGSGLEWTPIGPVGADAKVYLDLERESFTDQLRAYAPDLIVLMVGGNDALKIRKKWTTLEKVQKDHEALIDLLQATLPEADILLWTPMDAGDRKGGKIRSKAFLPEVAAMQKRVAAAKGCAVWDLLTVMGGPGAIEKWAAAGIMNDDLVHPKRHAAALIGELFSRAWLERAAKK